MFIAVAVAAIVIMAALVINLSPEYSWLSSIRDHDGDGVPDAEDDFPYDRDETSDRDGDGVGDNEDEFPSEPSQWSDLDGDGYGDNLTGVNPDWFRDDPTEWSDSDGDGVGDNSDAFPEDESQWSDLDGDGYGDNLTGNNPDQFRDDPTEWNDTDGDGVGDNSDAFPEDPDLWAETTPVATYSSVAIANGQQITIVSISKSDVSWDLVKVQLSDGTNFGEWNVDASDLDGGDAVTTNYSDVTLGSLTVCLLVTDVGGNGVVSCSDYFKVFTYGGATTFSGSVSYSAVLIYKPTDEKIGTEVSFVGSAEMTPTATYMKTRIVNGYQITIVSITRSDVTWDMVKVQLSDGTNFAEWDIVAADLDGGSAVTMNYTTTSLGALTVCLHVTDLAGNGLVNGGDYFKVFTYGGATGFSPATTYAAVLVYEPTAEKIGTGVTFTG